MIIWMGMEKNLQNAVVNIGDCYATLILSTKT